jgi:hypothetical protein
MAAVGGGVRQHYRRRLLHPMTVARGCDRGGGGDRLWWRRRRRLDSVATAAATAAAAAASLAAASLGGDGVGGDGDGGLACTDCCALVRRCVADLREEFGFTLGRWNQVQSSHESRTQV